ncbi:MAG: hypothetical protein AB203_02590 [Parcubacteria bacterium C7867-008]|nr:MAG: hypothetical protein AB203_02590 [Parcubacteria bacterium C7867-008]
MPKQVLILTGGILLVGVLGGVWYFNERIVEDVSDTHPPVEVQSAEISKEVRKTSETSANTTVSKYSAAKDVLPTTVGQCSVTKVEIVTNRLEAEDGSPQAGSGSVIGYTNHGGQVLYEQLLEIDNSKPGDEVTLCLLSIPQDCPEGDERGKIYRATNLRTGASWVAPDAQHFCGGA